MPFPSLWFSSTIMMDFRSNYDLNFCLRELNLFFSYSVQPEKKPSHPIVRICVYPTLNTSKISQNTIKLEIKNLMTKQKSMLGTTGQRCSSSWRHLDLQFPSWYQYMLPRMLKSQGVFADIMFCWLKEDIFYNPPRVGLKVMGQECIGLGHTLHIWQS